MSAHFLSHLSTFCKCLPTNGFTYRVGTVSSHYANICPYYAKICLYYANTYPHYANL